ncbi:MAG: HpcH/HpaI aldolase family protein [Pararhizobium sp.]
MSKTGPQKAFWLETESSVACEVARLARYDIVLFDAEHGVMSHTALDRLVPFAQQLGLAAYVRLADSQRSTIQHALDCGADGVVVPQIADLEHARQTAAMAKYPPAGTRGIGYSRAMGYAAVTDDLLAHENRRRHVYLMIETPGALEAVDAIAALDTVDGLFVGPADLSATRGRGAFTAKQEDLDDITRVALAARRVGKPWAVPALDPRVQDLCFRYEAGFVALGDDITALAEGFRSLIGRADRSAPGPGRGR